MNPHAIIVNRILFHSSNDDHEYTFPEIQGILVLTYEMILKANSTNPSIDHISMAYCKDETILIKIPNNTIPYILDISVIEKNTDILLIIESPCLFTQSH